MIDSAPDRNLDRICDRGLYAGDSRIVDYMKGTQVINLFSDQASTLGIRKAMNALRENPSNGLAIIKALDRAVKLGQHKQVMAIVVTSGTSDRHLLAWLYKLMERRSLSSGIVSISLTDFTARLHSYSDLVQAGQDLCRCDRLA